MNLSELKEVAEAAGTENRWTSVCEKRGAKKSVWLDDAEERVDPFPDYEGQPSRYGPKREYICNAQSKTVAKFIATFDPPTVKALIERIEELEERTIPDDLTSYIQERVKAERERCASIVERNHGKFGRRSLLEILNPTESEASDE